MNFLPYELEIWWMTLKNNMAHLQDYMWPWNLRSWKIMIYRAPLSFYVKLFVSCQSHQWIQTRFTVRNRSIRVKIGDFFVPCDLEIWRMILKNNRTHFLCYFKHCASFNSHQWIQTEVTVGKRRIWVKIEDFAVPCDTEIWETTSKNNRAFLLCSVMHYLVAIGDSKLELLRHHPIWVNIIDFF